MISLIREIGRSGFSTRSSEAEEQVMTNDLGQTQDIIEARLREKLTPEALELFEKYQECSEKLYLRECDQEFLSGFRLGGRLMIEILVD